MQNTQLYFQTKDDYYLELFHLSDCQLLTEDGSAYDVHKIELAKRSNYFYRLFCGQIGKDKNKFLIPGISGETLRNILSFIYTGSLSITEANVCEILISADYLLLDDLVMHIKNVYLVDSLTISSCLPLFVTAMQINRKDVLRQTFRFIQTHFEAVVMDSDSGLGDLSLVGFELFLVDKNLCVRDESVVWMAITKWVQAEINHRQSFVPELLTYLTVSDIDEKLAMKILEHEIVNLNPFCKKVNDLKQSSSVAHKTDLEILLTYMQNHSNSALLFPNIRRIPTNLHFIAHYCVYNQTDGIYIYVTYDENIDLWRKIVEADICPDYMVSVGHKIYLFKTSDDTNLCLNLVDNEWEAMTHFRSLRNYYGVVHLNGFIYVLGGLSVEFGQDIDDVEVYDPCVDMWYDATPMFPVHSFNVVALGNRIYVVGISPTIFGFEMIAQVYDPGTNEWSILTPPSVYRFKSSLVVYKGNLYVIGGRNGDRNLRNVEVYDPNKQEWISHKSIPYAYYSPKAIVLNDKLFVYDNHLEDRKYLKTNPTVVWDEELEHWMEFEESSPMNSIHQYYFFTPDSRDCVKWISVQNKDPAKRFHRTPFN